MGDKTGIEWTDATWNPVTGCDKVSPGCDHCYAETFAERWRGTEGHYFANGFDVQLRPDKLDLPLRWTKPRKVFVNSMSDLFHDKVPDDYIAEVFAVMACSFCWDRPTHTFQLLTKRHARMRSLLSSDEFRARVARIAAGMSEDGDNVHDAIYYHYWPLPNVWLGVSAEDQKRADLRIPALLDTPAAVRFVSAEPLLGPINLHTDPIEAGSPFWGSQLDWVIVGGESGHEDRPMHVDWVRSLRDQCLAASVPFLFKQWGETVPLGQMTDEARRRWDDYHACDVYPEESLWRIGKKRAGRELDGRTWDQYPEAVA
ncbi:bacteriophage protein gp37 [Mycobacteroides abscessus subsp. abscessus]|jgi:protein gp37|uniref:DUF5131 family protein n=1 Tax=Mycobacteroides abscessus TaxID=36809 RepID=UPI00092B5EF5|nr:phage Gp37/Gp68 family protein [Mycobacteroides abscessus]SII86197.1 bacteriophage protein gp37 [Mycobacteroides abscessus subsp. abscessus]SIK03834.1 bacteriophage protein gp37 [Mycobacteroides abscessus subsp. abscessus]SIK07446.1 bacteriophage protein gp37 [Mycobacteroides abscessus subsp. abscessus]SIM06768.1 bacteriophage protein gp37 [Mycobacteroides abscessus subsp. abscessus]SIN56935.1 bacteriophage protein gp37 [Mycobacteroides abscessus subsp. abscessus]